MTPFKYFGSFIWLSLSLFVLVMQNANAQDSLRNLPEYSLPLTDQKLVVAHCMTNIIRFKGHEFEGILLRLSVG